MESSAISNISACGVASPYLGHERVVLLSYVVMFLCAISVSLWWKLFGVIGNSPFALSLPTKEKKIYHRDTEIAQSYFLNFQGNERFVVEAGQADDLAF
jgi:hypothetical protein